MQGFRSSNSRPGSSEMQQKTSPSSSNLKRSPSPKITRGSSASSDSIESRVSRVPDRKPSPMSQYFQEKQRTMRVSEMQQQLGKVLADMKRAKEERSQALEELAELKKKNEGFTQRNERITMLESELEKAQESEMKLLESLISQTKELEQTKILLEEAKLEIRNLSENPEKKGLLASVQTIQAQDEIRMLRNELRLALQAEEKSKKAMDDFVLALKEVTTEATLAKEELDVRKSELEIVRAEAEHANSLLENTEQKLQLALEEYNKLKLESEEAATAWKVKEDSFINCIKIAEDDMEKKDEEISKLVNAHKVAKEENSKLRDIIKQAVNEAMVVKESLAIVQNENYELKEQLSEKGSALEKIRREFESLKVSETAALATVREMKSSLTSSSGTASNNKASNLLDIEPFGQSKETGDDRKISKNTKLFSSDRWENPRIHNGHRRSVGETDISKNLAFDRKGAFENRDERLSSDAFEHLDGMLFHGMENDKQKKKKTVFGRFGDALRRRSFRKT